MRLASFAFALFIATLPTNLGGQVVLDHGDWVRALSSSGVIYTGRIATSAFGLETSDSIRINIQKSHRGALALSKSDTVVAFLSADLVRLEQGHDRGVGWVRKWATLGFVAGAGAGMLFGLTTPSVNTTTQKGGAIAVSAFAGLLTGQASAQMSRVRWTTIWRHHSLDSTESSGPRDPMMATPVRP